MALTARVTAALLLLLSAMACGNPFTCEGRYDGYYADEASRCKGFHLCQNGVQYSFVCPKGTLFHEEIAVCDWKRNVTCRTHRKKSPRGQRAPHSGVGGHGPSKVCSSSYGRKGSSSPLYHLTYEPNYHEESHEKHSDLPVSLVMSPDGHDSVPHVPDTIIYLKSHHHTDEHHTAGFQHHINKQLSKHKEAPAASAYEHIPGRDDVVEVLIYSHKGEKTAKNTRPKGNLLSSESKTVVVILDECESGTDPPPHSHGSYSPVDEAYFAEDEEDNLRHSYEVDGLPDYGKLHYQTKSPTSTFRVYDSQFHNLRNFKNRDVVVSVKNKGHSKPVTNSHTGREAIAYISNEPSNSNKVNYVSSTPRGTTALTLKPFKKAETRTKNIDTETFVPNLSPTDIMSSLFLQSLLVKAFDQTFLSTTRIPGTTLGLNTAAQSERKQSGSPEALQFSRLDVDDSSPAYRYRKMFNVSATRDAQDATVAQVKVDEPSLPLSEALLAAAPGSTSHAAQSLSGSTVSAATTVTQTTSVSPLLSMLMSIMANSTVVISRNPMMILNQQNVTNVKENLIINDYGEIEQTNPAVNSLQAEVPVATTTAVPVVVDNFTVIAETVSVSPDLSNKEKVQLLPSIDDQIIGTNIENESVNTSRFIEEFSSVAYPRLNHVKEEEVSSIKHPLMQNLEIHVHVHTPKPKMSPAYGQNDIPYNTSPAVLVRTSLVPAALSRSPATFKTSETSLSSRPPIASLFPNFPSKPRISFLATKNRETSQYKKLSPFTADSHSTVLFNASPYSTRAYSTGLLTTTPYSTGTYTTRRYTAGPFSTGPPMLLHHRQNKLKEQDIKGEESKSAAHRLSLPDTATNSPVGYDIIVSRTPPVIDGEIIPTPHHQNEQKQLIIPSATTSNKQRDTTQHKSPVILQNSMTANDQIDSNHAFHMKNVFTQKPSISFGTFKPVQSLPWYIPSGLHPSTAPSQALHSSVSHSGSNLNNLPPAPAGHLLLFDDTSYKSPSDDGRAVVPHGSADVNLGQHTFLVLAPPRGVPLQRSSGVPLQRTIGAASRGYVIPVQDGYIAGSVRALSAFNSLPDMFGSSYSVPLPLQSHAK